MFPSQLPQIYLNIGLRLLSVEDQTRVLDEVKRTLSLSNFVVGEDSVRVLSGRDEGLYGWITVNFLKKTLFNNGQKTFGALDMGGASTQVNNNLKISAEVLIEDLHRRFNVFRLRLNLTMSTLSNSNWAAKHTRFSRIPI